MAPVEPHPAVPPAQAAFDIEEIFPDGPGRSAELPRRQSGSAPQGLAVTLLADYTVRTGGWVPSAAIVALLAESGVSEAGARAAISRLARRGVLQGRRDGRRSAYRLAPPVAANLAAGGRWIVASMAEVRPWDGRWTLVAFSLPQESAAQRQALRGQLRWLGYAPLYDGLWVSPAELGPRAREQLAGLALGTMTVFRARPVDLPAGREPLSAWDVEAVAARYHTFVRRWSGLLGPVRAGEVTGVAAVRARTEVMDTYRQFPVVDPQLPLPLLPPGWPRAAAREVFTAIYDGLAGPAQQHVRAVVAGHGGDPAGILAHTTADLVA